MNITFRYCVQKKVKEIIYFGDIEVEKHKFHHCKSLILLEDVDIKKIQVSNMVSSGKRNINILLVTKIMLPKTSGYVKRYDGETKWMLFC